MLINKNQQILLDDTVIPLFNTLDTPYTNYSIGISKLKSMIKNLSTRDKVERAADILQAIFLVTQMSKEEIKQWYDTTLGDSANHFVEPEYTNYEMPESHSIEDEIQLLFIKIDKDINNSNADSV